MRGRSLLLQQQQEKLARSEGREVVFIYSFVCLFVWIGQEYVQLVSKCLQWLGTPPNAKGAGAPRRHRLCQLCVATELRRHRRAGEPLQDSGLGLGRDCGSFGGTLWPSTTCPCLRASPTLADSER